MALYEKELGIASIKDIPAKPVDCILEVLQDYHQEDFTAIFEYHLTALPGWTGYIKHRMETNSAWQQNYPISLEDYLAVRLWICKKFGYAIRPVSKQNQETGIVPQLQYIWLKAWELSWQDELSNNVQSEENQLNGTLKEGLADAQLVFCIDTRSEAIRRHVESKGNYETFGYAGFFGIAMDYSDPQSGITSKSCPPIVPSAYKVTEQAQFNKTQEFNNINKRYKQLNFKAYFLKRMKNMLPSGFGYVEGSGFFYGLHLSLRSLIPAKLYDLRNKYSIQTEKATEPKLEAYVRTEHDHSIIRLDEKVQIVKSAFDLLGWKQFAPLVVFVGHGSHSANNPFSSSLDCGACAARPGRHNARTLAQLANLTEVRKALELLHGIRIPNSTVFIGGEHNTTTDDITLFDADTPLSHSDYLKRLKHSLKLAQTTAALEKNQGSDKAVEELKQKANNWSETRPEWGLAGNAGFVIGPRKLTKNQVLDGRCFLHSYDWKLDKNGTALEGIMQGPLVVTQWINNHYYFSAVDNEAFGGGSKISHNITGKFGVVQGNGGDLKIGLPLQSIYQSDKELYHQPLRLSALIQAPIERVEEILARNSNVKMLLDNEWIYLMVMDPTQNNSIMRYNGAMTWETVKEKNLKQTAKPEEYDFTSPLGFN